MTPTQKASFTQLARLAEGAQDADRYPVALTAYNQIVKKATDCRLGCVQEMRDLGYSWREIGGALGTSSQAAWEKYARSGLVTDTDLPGTTGVID